MIFKIILISIILILIIFCFFKIFYNTSMRIIHHYLLKKGIKNNYKCFNSLKEFMILLDNNLNLYDTDSKAVYRLTSINNKIDTIEFFKSKEDLENNVESNFKLGFDTIIINNNNYYFKNYNDYYDYFGLISTVFNKVKKGNL